MKAILVIDVMPKCCVACPFFEFVNTDDVEDCRTICVVKYDEVNENGIEVRPKWCPLKPLPQKKDVPLDYGMMYGNPFGEGWNACLKEIEK